MNKNRQKNLFRQNLNINNKNMHENIYAQHPTVKSHCRHHKKLSAFHWRPWSDFNFSPSCSFSVCVLLIFYMTDFPNPCPEFCNCTGDPLRLQRGKAWRLNGFKLFIPAERWKTTQGREKAERREYKRKTWQRTQHKHCLCTKECGQRGEGLAVDIFLAYHQDAHRAASGVWHFGIQSGSCGAGTAELWNLQSAWDSHLRCTTGTRSLLLGSPGRRSMGWATKWMNIRGADQTAKTCYKLWKVETNPPPRLSLCKIHPHVWLKTILSCYGWFAGGASFQGSNTIYITVIHLMGVDYLNQASWVLLKWQILAFEKDLRRRSRTNNTDDFIQKVFQTWSSTKQYEAEHRVWSLSVKLYIKSFSQCFDFLWLKPTKRQENAAVSCFHICQPWKTAYI